MTFVMKNMFPAGILSRRPNTEVNPPTRINPTTMRHFGDAPLDRKYPTTGGEKRPNRAFAEKITPISKLTKCLIRASVGKNGAKTPNVDEQKRTPEAAIMRTVHCRRDNCIISLILQLSFRCQH